MTELMERALSEMVKLPETEQDLFASWILEELAETRKADVASFEEQRLRSLLDQARAEFRAGETKPMSKDRVIADD